MSKYDKVGTTPTLDPDSDDDEVNVFTAEALTQRQTEMDKLIADHNRRRLCRERGLLAFLMFVFLLAVFMVWFLSR